MIVKDVTVDIHTINTYFSNLFCSNLFKGIKVKV